MATTADQNRISTHVTALLNASTRSVAGVPNYTSAVGDLARSPAEIAMSVSHAAMEVARAVCETAGHVWRESFLEEVELSHAAPIEFSYGTTEIPQIQPFEDADYRIDGVRRSFDKINSYRLDKTRAANDRIYSRIAHDESNGGLPAKLAGFYDIVNGIFYFTGHAAFMRLARFDADDVFSKLPDAVEPVIARIALGASAKEGDTSDGLFAAWRQTGINDLQQIRSGATVFSPVDDAVQIRGSQTR